MTNILNHQHLNTLRQFYNKRRRLPTYSELLALFGWRSKNAAYRFMHRLRAHGFIQQESEHSHKHGHIGKFSPTTKLFGTKLLGTIAAGFPSPAEEELTDVISLDQYLIEHPTSSFVVRVSGDSMIDAGIHPNDLVIVERHRSPTNDDIVIAYVDHAWTMKRFVKQGQRVLLLPANKKYQPIQPTDELKIEGVVVGVVRKYH